MRDAQFVILDNVFVYTVRMCAGGALGERVYQPDEPVFIVLFLMHTQHCSYLLFPSQRPSLLPSLLLSLLPPLYVHR